MGSPPIQRAVGLAMTVLLLMGMLAPAVQAADPMTTPAADPMTTPTADPSLDPPAASPATEPAPSETSSGGIEVAAAQATTTWFSGVNSGVRGRQQNFEVAVNPAPDGGMIELRADGELVASKDFFVGGYYVSIGWTPPEARTYVMTATFTGTAAFASSTSNPYQNQVYLPPPISVTVTKDPATVQRGIEHTFTATVLPDVGEGQAALYVDGEVSSTVDLIDGIATFTTTFETTGYHSVVARFLGNADWAARSSDIMGFQVAGDGVAMTLAVPSNPMPAGPVPLTVTLSPDPGDGILQVRPCSWCQSTEVPVTAGGVTVVNLGTLGVSYYDYHVTFLGTATYAPAESNLGFSVWSTTSTTISTNRTSATVGELPVKLTATVTGDVSTGTVTFQDTVNGSTINLGPATINAYTKQAVFSTSSLRVGTHQIRAVYNGADWTLGSTSAPITVVVAADTAVHATFAPSRASFYPYKDYFADTVSLGGVLDEKATVTVRIYTSGGTLKRTFSLGTVGPGKYAATWNGRTSGGTALPAGKYTVRASFKDAKGNVRTITGYTTVSWRKAVWRSVSVVQYGDQGTYFVDVGGQGKLYYSDDYGRGRIMDSGEMIRDCQGCGYVAGRFRFQVRTGALEYKSMYLQVAGHGFVDREHPGEVSVLDPKTGDTAERVPLPYYPGLGGLTFSPSRISSTGRVEAWLEMQQRWGDAFDVHYVKLTYKYAVWAP